MARELLPALGRNYLHAARIAFTHPRTGEQMEFRAPLPEELVKYIRALGEVTKSAAGEAVAADDSSIDAALKDYL